MTRSITDIAADLEAAIITDIAADIDVTVRGERIIVQWSTEVGEELTEEQAAEIERDIERAAQALGLTFNGNSGGTGRYLEFGEERAGCWSQWESVGITERASFLHHLPVFLDDTKHSESGKELGKKLRDTIYQHTSRRATDMDEE